jgi:hypothetical protein
MRTLLAISLLLGCALPALAPAQQPLAPPYWAFEGVLPMMTQMRGLVPIDLYIEQGHVLSPEEIAASLNIELGDALVMVRDGKIVGHGTVAEIVAQRRTDALRNQTLFIRPAGLPEELEIPDFPRGPAAVEDASYDLYIVTDEPVEILPPEPKFLQIPWGAHDYCVQVGEHRYAVIRERWPRTGGFRGWQVVRLHTTTNDIKLHSDHTWTPQ